jgi:hypothetical protein
MQRGRTWWAVALAAGVGAAAAASGSGEETELGYQKDTGTHVYARVAGNRLVLRSLGPSTSRVAYGIDLDGNGKITETDLYYTLQPDGRICTGPWLPARNVLECTRASRASGSQETIGPQTLRRLEIPLDEVAPTARSLRMLLMMNKPAGGNATAWLSYDLVTGKVRGLPAEPAKAPSAQLVESNGTAAPAQKASLSDRQLTDRHETAQEFYDKVCSFRQLPGIRLLNNRFTGLRGQFRVRPVESDSVYNNDLSVSITPAGGVEVRIVVSDRRHVAARIKRAELVLGDGRRFDARPIHPFERIGTPMTYKPYVTIEEPSRELAEALASNNTARLVLSNDQGEASRWNYRIENLRYLKPAMERSQWKCTGAW